jgi:hypothetical protein
MTFSTSSNFSLSKPVLVVAALRAVFAIFRAGAGFDRQQRAHLHLVRVEMFAVHLLGAEQQVVKRQVEQREDLGAVQSWRMALEEWTE